MCRRSNSFDSATLLTETDGRGDGCAMGCDTVDADDRRDRDGWVESDEFEVRVSCQPVGH
jgi:hypothetical protein